MQQDSNFHNFCVAIVGGSPLWIASYLPMLAAELPPIHPLLVTVILFFLGKAIDIWRDNRKRANMRESLSSEKKSKE